VAKYLIDANLPYRFKLWQGDDFQHVFDLDDTWPDKEIWSHAKEHGLTIVTKDADFSGWILLSDPPPKVIHLRIGNMKMRDLFSFLQRHWDEIAGLSETHKLVSVYQGEIECVE
jgi:predicted nuclease of predicted toxin-antitoxin system